MGARLLQVTGVIVAVLFGGASGLVLLANSGFGPNSDVQHSCVMAPAEEWPEVGGPYTEATLITGEPTWFPLGQRCTYDSPLDALGPQEFVREDWGATIIWLGSGVLAIGGIALAYRATSARERRRARRPRNLA
jgi:hypothetical protein